MGVVGVAVRSSVKMAFSCSVFNSADGWKVSKGAVSPVVSLTIR